ncbi:hypothetical protein BN12_4120008 [Nostocoides japonicum T1-X7]|uniref:Uncharacterized protein n=1 Tax=Nostocoides japonicum T1-X7 TaxID=1194083 RepID=A0A077M5H1_9MICO|nr:hypothetical protein BN12_4120008 [Tetrasphaera japonica T1-X7]
MSFARRLIRAKDQARQFEDLACGQKISLRLFIEHTQHLERGWPDLSVTTEHAFDPSESALADNFGLGLGNTSQTFRLQSGSKLSQFGDTPR